MPAIALGKNAYERAYGTEIRLVNRYFEADPVNLTDGVALLARPGLVLDSTVGSGPIRGAFRQSGLFDGDLFVVSGTTAYRDGVSLGTVAGSDLIRWAGTDVSGDRLFFAAGGLLKLYDGTSLTTVATPDDVAIDDVAELNGYIVCQVQGSGRRYFIPPGEATIDALDFFTAESSPDDAIATITVGEELWLIDRATAEVWYPTGLADPPFQRAAGRTSAMGATSRDTVVHLDNAFYFVGEDSEQGRVVYRAGDPPTRVSTHGIEEHLRRATGLSAMAFTFDGHPFYLLRKEGEGTFALDVSTGGWSEWASFGRETFRAQVACAAPGFPLLLGDDATGNLYALDPDSGADDGSPMIRVATGGVPIPEGRQVISNLSLQASVGITTDLELDPQIALVTSRDGGRTWSEPRYRSLGKIGEFGKRVRWERLGQFRSPGFLFELIDSDDVPTRLSYCRANSEF